MLVKAFYFWMLKLIEWTWNFNKYNTIVKQTASLMVCKSRTCAFSHWKYNTSKKQTKLAPWPESTSELYRPSNHRLSAKLVPNFADRESHVVSVRDFYGRILGFLDRSRCIFFQVAPQWYSRSWADLLPDPLLVIKSGRAGNRTRTSGSVTRNSYY
jgi:hypothetical protein